MIRNRDAPERLLRHGQDDAHTIGVALFELPRLLVVKVAVRVAHDGLDLCGNQPVSQSGGVDFDLRTGVDLAERLVERERVHVWAHGIGQGVRRIQQRRVVGRQIR